ncbi:MAG: copper chaperone PCu(A)C [Cardiobacteriaceae bacterium]|nr:copper chaperone PCu(A)C [Cardiobacteriaceae bacterium]
MKKKIFILGALFSGVAIAGDISVKDCLIQEVIPGKQMTGAFFTLENMGKETIKLTGVTLSKLSDKVEIHEMIHQNGKMEMSQIQDYDITPGEHRFKKGGYHAMLMDVKHIPKIGDSYPLELKLSNGLTLTCDAKVLSVEDTIKHFVPEDGKIDAMKMEDHNHNMNMDGAPQEQGHQHTKHESEHTHKEK